LKGLIQAVARPKQRLSSAFEGVFSVVTPEETRSLSIYFYTGDFVEAYRRFKAGEPQIYATHDEVCRLFDQLGEAEISVSVYSFLTENRSVNALSDQLTITSMGARAWNDNALLRRTLRADQSHAIVPHFGNATLVGMAIKSRARVAAVTAGSFNRGTLRERFQRSRMVRLYNNPRIDLVANHCIPSTLKLLEYGVDPAKLLAWDVPHQYTPFDFSPKTRSRADRFEIAYAGSVSEPKGVGDLIRAVAVLKQRGKIVSAKIAGKGQIEAMKQLAESLGVSDQIDLLGLVPNSHVISLFHSSDAVCVPSRPDFPEGFPLTMFEAIASRSPIICSDHPMFRDIMRDGQSALVFKAGNEDNFADKIARLMDDPMLYEALSRDANIAWERLSQTADWRTLLFNWATTGFDDPWIQERVMARNRTAMTP
jgi:glycosyltransferase involved in cell wall biosynthesis